MSKKTDFLRSQQNRDKHPESQMTGSAASVTQQQARKGASAKDRQEPHTPKYSNDHNKVGETKPTQKNEGRRTPRSRHDREIIGAGSMNVVEARTGGKGAGRGSRGGGSSR